MKNKRKAVGRKIGKSMERADIFGCVTSLVSESRVLGFSYGLSYFLRPCSYTVHLTFGISVSFIFKTKVRFIVQSITYIVERSAPLAIVC